MWLVVFTKQAQKDARQLKAAGLAGKAKALVAAVREDPFKVPPRYEALVGNLSGLYSRRISLQHRFVYEVIKEEIERDGALYEGAVKVVRMWTHYDGVR
ncbi:Plasmid encoded toxin Txe [Collinsella aerofaciens]|uniref:Endoribonuclease YoeB n=1 Tax=Collinsella aerofaciens TaxID=74426 RepID=A0A5K1JF70_9ACTN|nr:Plasmid encoded toxin Txe [Collinsella aerofaciens]